ncbi:MAG TPA: PsiF family protein [Usitatibacter sp.]|nr:PsiF family protein [Usitatibacter sp.]
MKPRHLYLAACAIALALGAAPLRAADSESHPPTQREKFAACAHQTRGLKADERREFMSECLRKHDAKAPVAAEADGARLRPCSAEADRRKLRGDERRAFLGSCLKG